MSLFHTLIGRRGGRHHHHHHGHHGHHGGRFRDSESPGLFGDADRRSHRAERAAYLLNLDAVQLQQLDALMAQFDTFRASAKGAVVQDLSEVLAVGDLNRQTLQSFVDRRIAHVQQNASQMVGALGDFIEALNADQQHTVKVLLRMLAARGARRSQPPADPNPEPVQ